MILLCEGRTTPIVKSMNEPQIREQCHKILEDEKTQVAVAKVFERLKKQAQIDNFLTNTSTRGIQPTAGTSEGRNRVSNAGYRTRGNPSPADPERGQHRRRMIGLHLYLEEDSYH